LIRQRFPFINNLYSDIEVVVRMEPEVEVVTEAVEELKEEEVDPEEGVRTGTVIRQHNYQD